MSADSSRRLLSGWGRTAATSASVSQVPIDDISRLLARPPRRGVVARGLGRAYGDSAQNAGGFVIDMRANANILSFNDVSGVIHAEAGVSLGEIMTRALPRGWFVPITAGTRHVTLGGAIAADIHGKNHHRDGSFARFVRDLDLIVPGGERITVSAESDPDLFWATLGGMGLTGVIVSASLKLIAAATPSMTVDTRRCDDLRTLVSCLAEADSKRYSVAWIDCLTRGRHAGRGVVSCGDHAPADSRTESQERALFAPRQRLTLPAFTPRVVSRTGIAAFNEAWFRRAPRARVDEIQSVPAFFHPLDGIGAWNRAYGPKGFTQYQCVVPTEADLDAVLLRIRESQVPPALAVLKRFGDTNPGPLSFPRPGWTLAVDFPTGSAELARLLDRLDETVAAAGGSVYLAKDGRLRPEMMDVMYPKLHQWQGVRERIDPQRIMVSDQSRRLGL